MNVTLYIMVFIEGILTFISPCILPLLPVYFLYMAGNAAQGDAGYKRKLVLNSLGFVIGFTVIFTILGASATFIGSLLKEYIDIFRKVSGIIIIIFGLYFIGIIKLNFLNFEKRLTNNVKTKGFFPSILLGIVFAFGWSPCVGPFLASVLLLSASSETLTQGIMLLLVYSIGLGIPFVISALVIDKLKDVLRVIQEKQKIIKIISGIVLIIIGVLILFDKISLFIA